jgi:hypothetical protein
VRAGLPGGIRRILEESYQRLGTGHVSVAIHPSATAEELRNASYGGEQAFFLNIASVQKNPDVSWIVCHPSIRIDRVSKIIAQKLVYYITYRGLVRSHADPRWQWSLYDK